MVKDWNGFTSIFMHKRNGNTIKIQNENYDYKTSKKYPSGSIEFEILLDEIAFKRY